MEDRHYLNEPRPVPGLTLPTWDVDIMREGVDTPILTLRVDADVLPPRRGKKKKIVWKLPDDVTLIPKFGVEDRKRLFELYKQEKKLRRLSRKTSTNVDAANSLAADANAVKKFDQETGPPNKDPTGSPSSNGGKGGSSNGAKSKDKRDTTSKENNRTHQQQLQPDPNVGRTPVGPPPGVSTTPIRTPPAPPVAKTLPPAPGFAPPGFSSSTMKALVASVSDDDSHDYSHTGGFHDEKKTNGTNQRNHIRSPISKSITPPTSRTSSSSPPRPAPAPASGPPGLASASTTPHHPHQQPQHHDQPPAPPPGMIGSPTLGATTTPAPKTNIPHKTIPVPPGTALASVVAELYYNLLTHGLVSELLPFYTETAQKSLTVGGAHAVCGPTLAEKELQLKHLVGMVVTIKGCLQQPTVGPGVLVTITGICRQPHALPFCHSLIMVPVDEGFQIQNDALCFLTPE